MNKTVCVYFSGTGFSINKSTYLASYLHTITAESDSQINIGVDGCGVAYGFNGIIFGSGLDKQCEPIIDRITQEINAGHKITLNVYGHSRGGIAALLLAKQLGKVDKEKLTINLALLDPVPGNFITTSSLDPFKISLANKTMDLSDCKPLRKVLALYPNMPLSAIACHAPLFASYPKETEVEEEVIYGCHSQTERLNDTIFSELARLRVKEFLIQNGSKLLANRWYNDSEAMKQTYLDLYQEELNCVNEASSREAHSSRGVVIAAIPGANYLNSRHKALMGDNSEAPVSLSIQPKKGVFSWVKRFFTNHPLVGKTIKWSLIALSIASLLYFTGGLAAIPLLAPIAVKLGALSLIALFPVIGATLAALWYGVAKPILLWCASKFFYPRYAIHKIEAPSSTIKLINLLSVNYSLAANSPVANANPYQEKYSPMLTKKMHEKEPLHDNEQKTIYVK